MMREDLPYYIKELNDLQKMIEKRICSPSHALLCKKTERYQKRKRELLNLLIETLDITV